MGAAIQLRREPLSVQEHQRVWHALCEDASLQAIPYKIETDAWGQLHMNPTQTRHSRMVRRIARLLEDKLGSEALTELAILTPEGIKVPDVAWCSEAFLAHYWSDTVLLKAPEICVEVVSPSNSEAVLRQKTGMYLDGGAVEVWLVLEGGTVDIHTKAGLRDNSSFGFDPASALSVD
jgi:Uma2 family endonuclease